MKCLKIKDNVDLKELDKHLKKLTIIDGDEIYVDYETDEKCKDVYCFIDEYDSQLYSDEIKKGYIDNDATQFYFNSHKKMVCCTYPENLDIIAICYKTYELTKADLLEVVDDKQQ